MTSPRTQDELVLITRPRLMPIAGGPQAWPPVVHLAESQLRKTIESQGCSFQPIFGTSRRPLAGLAGMPAKAASPLDGYYCVTGPPLKLHQLAQQLRGELAAAYVRPAAELAPFARPAVARRQLAARPTGDFRADQGHLGPPPGVNARAAWATPGALGAGVRIIDIEWAWRFDHENILGLEGGILGPRSNADDDHGTAVLGILGAQHKGFGVEGIVPKARVDALALSDPQTDAGAPPRPLPALIYAAAVQLNAGDIILLEVQLPGPKCGFKPNEDGQGYIAPEWWPDVFEAIRYATSKGVVVVEAAGNGSESLDDERYDTAADGFPQRWSNPFKGNRASGAILVAAGDSQNTEKLGPSNHGKRVDANAWGHQIVTTGYGDWANGGHDRKYAGNFGGTSGAAAIVAGAIASVQGALRSRCRAPLPPAEVACLLRRSGQPPPPGALIGHRPDIPEMIKLALER